MTTPNRENIAKWVEALRSGDYTQGIGALASFEGESVQYCCLGVASEISGVCQIKKDAMSDGRGVLAYDGSRSFLPMSVQEWLGVDGDAPDVRAGALSAINDDGASFAEIADLIEAEWLS